MLLYFAPTLLAAISAAASAAIQARPAAPAEDVRVLIDQLKRKGEWPSSWFPFSEFWSNRTEILYPAGGEIRVGGGDPLRCVNGRLRSAKAPRKVRIEFQLDDEQEEFVIEEVNFSCRPSPGTPVACSAIRITRDGHGSLFLAEVVPIYARDPTATMAGSQSSTAASAPRAWPGFSTSRLAREGADKALDGSFVGAGHSTAAVTRIEANPWWKVQFSSEVLLSGVQLWADPDDDRSTEGLKVEFLDEEGRLLWHSAALPRLAPGTPIGPVYRQPIGAIYHSSFGLKSDALWKGASSFDREPRFTRGPRRSTSVGVIYALPEFPRWQGSILVQAKLSPSSNNQVSGIWMALHEGENAAPVLPTSLTRPFFGFRLFGGGSPEVVAERKFVRAAFVAAATAGGAVWYWSDAALLTAFTQVPVPETSRNSAVGQRILGVELPQVLTPSMRVILIDELQQRAAKEQVKPAPK